MNLISRYNCKLDASVFTEPKLLPQQVVRIARLLLTYSWLTACFLHADIQYYNFQTTAERKS